MPIPHIGNYANETNASLRVISGSTHFSPLPILVEIDGAENGDFSFRWSIDNGVTFVEEKQSINGSPKLSDYGMVLSFESLKEERYHLGDRWTFTAYPKHEIVRITKSFDEASIYANRAKVRLFEALQRLYLSEEISIHSTINNVDEKIYLRYTYDMPTTMFASVDDNSSAIFSYSTDNNMLLSTHVDSTEAQPFGITWKPNQSDNYVIFAVAEDYSRQPGN